MTKQEQRHQIIITLIYKDFGTHNVVKFANNIMAEMYGKDWESQPEVEECINYERVPIVSIAEQDGQKGVRFCIGDVDMFIEAYNLDNGEVFEWKKAMARLEEVGKRTFDKHEMYLIAAYKDEINAKLKEIGGDELKGYCWTSTKYSTYSAWDVSFGSGFVGTSPKSLASVVRPCAAFKH